MSNEVQVASSSLDQSHSGSHNLCRAQRRYSASDFIVFLRNRRSASAIGLCFLLIGYSGRIFSNVFSIDTQGIIDTQGSLYNSWFQLDRFGLVLFKYISGTYWYNNSLSSFLTVLLFFISGLLWGYVFFSHEDEKPIVSSAEFTVFLVIYYTSPIFSEMLGFLLLGPEVSVASILCSISMMIASMISNTSGWKRVAEFIFAVLLAAMSFSMYLAMVTIFITGTAILLYEFSTRVQTSNIKTVITKVLTYILVFFSGYFIYRVSNSAVHHITHTTTNPYISDQSNWGKFPLRDVVKGILVHARDVYSGLGIFYTKFFSITLLVALCIHIFYVVLRRENIISLILFFLICCSPMLMSVALGGAPSVRTEMAYAFAFAFCVSLFPPFLSSLSIFSKSNRIVAVAVIIFCLIGANQAFIVNRIFYTENIVFHQDVLTAVQIKDRIDQLGYGESPSIPVVFVNNHVALCNSDCFPQSELGLTGRSMLEIGFSTEHGSGVKTEFIASTLGVRYTLPSSVKEYSVANDAAQTMPHWPDSGSVAVKDNVIVVNF